MNQGSCPPIETASRHVSGHWCVCLVDGRHSKPRFPFCRPDPGPLSGISNLPAGSWPLYTNTPLRTPNFFIAGCSAPNTGHLRQRSTWNRLGAPAFRAFLRHRSTRVPCVIAGRASLHFRPRVSLPGLCTSSCANCLSWLRSVGLRRRPASGPSSAPSRSPCSDTGDPPARPRGSRHTTRGPAVSNWRDSGRSVRPGCAA